jgi:hypothetical protein
MGRNNKFKPGFKLRKKILYCGILIEGLPGPI